MQLSEQQQKYLRILGLGVALLLLMSIAASSYHSIQGYREDARLVEHTHEVLTQIEEVLSYLQDIVLAQRGYVATGERSYLGLYKRSIAEFNDGIGALKRMTADNSRQQDRVATVEARAREILATAQPSVELRHSGARPDTAAQINLINAGKVRIDQVRGVITEMKREEKELLAVRSREVEASARVSVYLIVFGGVAGLVLLLVVFGLLGREIHRRGRTQDALREANASLEHHATQLEATNKELESFSYSVSHDLRSPLRAVDGYSKMIEEDYAGVLDDEGRRLLAVIRDNSQKMGMLIDDLLEFSRLGRRTVDAVEFDMEALVREALREVVPAGAREPEWKVGRLHQAWGDRALLRQVWMNLLSNAVKFSAGRERPVIEMGSYADDGGNVYYVRDNGVGFDMQYYNKLFGVFQRLHSAEEFPGTGVGLAIVQRVVAKHDGRVWATGKVNEGATFFFALPTGAQHG